MLNIDVFPWNRNLEIGIVEIDAQHQLLVALINELCRALVAQKKDEITKQIQSVANYAEFHFAFEEKYWQTRLGGDAWVAHHGQAHQAFLPSISKIFQHIETKPIELVAEETVQFLIRWLARHILDEDRKMAHVIHYCEQGSTIEDAKVAAKKVTQDSTSVFSETLLAMYRSLSSQALDLLRERAARLAIENELVATNDELNRLNKKLTEQANYDELTHVGNRRSFECNAQKELKRCQRDGSGFTIILWDIDHFKLINDTYGHDAGDKALRAFAGCLKAHSHRPQDQVYRIGGEEFCQVTSHQTQHQAVALANKIKASVEQLNIHNRHSPTHPFMTVSAGVICLVPSTDDTLEQLLKRADGKLYQAKSLGRNQVVY